MSEMLDAFHHMMKHITDRFADPKQARKFYDVVGPVPHHLEYYDREAAEKAAQKMARKHPGKRFFVMKSISGFVVLDPPPPPEPELHNITIICEPKSDE